MLLHRRSPRLPSAVRTDRRGSGGASGLSACSLNQQPDRPKRILPGAAGASAAPQSTVIPSRGTGGGGLPTTPRTTPAGCLDG